jgi:dipeptidyl-peptidase-4
MVLHELAHGYHDQFVGGFDNAELKACYQHALAEKLYDSVLRINNRTEPAYAKTNQMEYFAEQTEAYFGTNDFYPYVRCELEQHDPQMYGLLGKLWSGETKK